MSRKIKVENVKIKDHSSASDVNGDIVRRGWEMLVVELDYIIRKTIEDMKEKTAPGADRFLS